LGLIVARDCFGSLDEDARIDAHGPANQAEYHDGPNPDPAAAPGNAAQSATPIFNSVAFR
jgi:hypothetical protein